MGGGRSAVRFDEPELAAAPAKQHAEAVGLDVAEQQERLAAGGQLEAAFSTDIGLNCARVTRTTRGPFARRRVPARRRRRRGPASRRRLRSSHLPFTFTRLALNLLDRRRSSAALHVAPAVRVDSMWSPRTCTVTSATRRSFSQREHDLRRDDGVAEQALEPRELAVDEAANPRGDVDVTAGEDESHEAIRR